jgi:hypothetical protein
MPYIDPQARRRLDPEIDILAEEIVKIAQGEPASFSGLVNYTCTRLVLLVLQGLFKKLRYWHIALVTGTLKNIADEFYRRVATPYENYCIQKNGDVDLIAFYGDQIEEMYKTSQS